MNCIVLIHFTVNIIIIYSFNFNYFFFLGGGKGVKLDIVSIYRNIYSIKNVILTCYFDNIKCNTNILFLFSNVTLYWHHLDKSLLNLLSLICLSQNGLLISSCISSFVFYAILLWEIHSLNKSSIDGINILFVHIF